MAVQWRDRAITPAPPLTRERLAEVADRLGVRFPADYIEVVRTHQGGAPDPAVVALADGTETTFSMLLHFEDQPEGLDLLGIVEQSDLLPEKVIPFAADPGDNYFCFDYRLTDVAPPVVFFATDDPDAEPASLANSFTDLIDSLQE